MPAAVLAVVGGVFAPMPLRAALRVARLRPAGVKLGRYYAGCQWRVLALDEVLPATTS